MKYTISISQDTPSSNFHFEIPSSIANIKDHGRELVNFIKKRRCINPQRSRTFPTPHVFPTGNGLAGHAYTCTNVCTQQGERASADLDDIRLNPLLPLIKRPPAANRPFNDSIKEDSRRNMCRHLPGCLGDQFEVVGYLK